jgi:7-carboxy-7-deazaguanine synthase (Cx14CxxC type)
VRYAVKEIYSTLQGEGYHTGRPAVLLRFAGCNLWSGREADRANAVCRFCDTEFVGTDGPGGGAFASPVALAHAVAAEWPAGQPSVPFVVCTGGEPLLQLDPSLIAALHDQGFEVAVETNGTRPAPPGLDWICVSPKARAALVLAKGDELKLVYPQAGAEPERYADFAFTHFYLQPMDGPDRERNTELVFRYVAEHPQWKVSLQTHKLMGIR